MARPVSPEKKREKTRESLIKSVNLAGLEEKYYLDKVEEYMSFYDDLTTINDQLKEIKSSDNFNLKSYTDAVAEKRRVSSEMRSILLFLGLKPPNGGGGSKYEEL